MSSTRMPLAARPRRPEHESKSDAAQSAQERTQPEGARVGGAAGVPLFLQGAGSLGSQTTATGGLAIGRPDDPFEREADRVAKHVTHAGSCGCRCAACAHKTRKAGPDLRPLDPAVGAPLARALGTGFDAVRVREHSIATHLGAAAFTQGNDITFAPGRFRPDTPAGQRLLAHELTHTLQQRPNPPGGLLAASRGLIQRVPATHIEPAATAASAEIDLRELNTIAREISKAVREGNASAAVAPLRDRSLEERKFIRQWVLGDTGVKLERWFVAQIDLAGTEDAARSEAAEEGVRRLWRAVPLIDRLELYDEGFREIEQAQLDVIRSASDEERALAAGPETIARLDAVLSEMNAREEYEARASIYRDVPGRVQTAKRMLKVGDEDPLFDAILDLPHERRRQFVMKEHYFELYHTLWDWQLSVLRSMVYGTEVDALLGRLQLATAGRIDDQEAVDSVMNRAVELLRERRDLQLAVEGNNITGNARREAEARLQQLADLDRLLDYKRVDGRELEGRSFLGRVSAARGDSDALGADAQRLTEFVPATNTRQFVFETAKQRILLAGARWETVQLILGTVHAPPDVGGARRSPVAQQAEDEKLRNDLLADDAVEAVVSRMVGSAQRHVGLAVHWTAYNEAHIHLTNAFHSARWGEFFHYVLVMARNPDWRDQYRRSATEFLSTYSRVRGRERVIMETILKTQQIPLTDLLDFTGRVESLRVAFEDISESDRAALRLGWYLTKRPQPPPADPTQRKQQNDALKLYQKFESHLIASQTSLWIFVDETGSQTVLGAALGSAPTAVELASPEGRYRAALVWYEQQQARLRLDRGTSAKFTEADETMVAAAREFAALWNEVGDRGTLSMIDFSSLAALHQRFEGRAGEFGEASNAIGEMAGMIAATVAGIVVVAATGGTATPGVIAIAAAAGGTSRVITREMFGGDYYAALSDDAARDALLGAVDAALAVVGSQLAARGAELLGLGGRALTRGAAHAAGEVVEHATQPLARRVLGSGVEAAIDGAFSGTISEAFGALTNEATWRRGIMDGLARVGQAALLGGLAGLGGGAVIGGLLPVAGAGGRWLWGAVAGKSLEHTLERAGASGLLAEARAAARAGKMDEVNAIAARLERHLGAEEALALRRQLADELRAVLPNSPGRATISKAEQALLSESSTIDTPVGRHFDNELEVVRHSRPQPSREPGYVDEVDLGNGHVWRRAEDNTWCRFTTKVLCGTEIPDAPPPTSKTPREAAREAVRQTDRARAAAARQIAEASSQSHADAEALQEALWNIYNKVRKAPLKGPTRIDTSLLEEEEKQLLRTVFHTDQPPFPVLRDAADRELEQPLLTLLRENADLAGTKATTAQQPLAVRLRSAISGMMDDIRGAAKGIDQISGLPAPSGALRVDHIVPFSDIIYMPGFLKLRWDDQVFFQALEDNLRAIDKGVHDFRGIKPWSDRSWLPAKHPYTEKQLAHITSEEARLRKWIAEEIQRRLPK